MALIAQLQEVWRTQIEDLLLVRPVFADTICNKNYEADLKTNKTVHIITMPELTGRTYTVNQYNASPTGWVWDKATTTSQTFQADQTWEIHPNVDPLEQMGSAMNLINELSPRVVRALRLAQDTYLASLHTQITTNVYGSSATPIVVGFDKTAGQVLPSVAMTQLQLLAAQNNANVETFNSVVPVWLASYLYQELSTRWTSSGDSALGAGVIPGQPMNIALGGFSKIVPSNNVYNTGGAAYKIMAANPHDAITFAESLTVNETGVVQQGYGDFIKMLNVYGAKVVQQGSMSLGTFTQGTARQ